MNAAVDLEDNADGEQHWFDLDEERVRGGVDVLIWSWLGIRDLHSISVKISGNPQTIGIFLKNSNNPNMTFIPINGIYLMVN